MPNVNINQQSILRNRQHSRRGGIAVEFATIVAVGLVLFFSAFEFCRVSLIRHTVDNAVYESARVGSIPGSTSQEVSNMAQQMLSTIGLSIATIKITPAEFDEDTDEVSVDIMVPIDKNSIGTSIFFEGKTVQRSITMPRELIN